MFTAKDVLLLTDAIKVSDMLTYKHCLRTAAYAVACARHIGLPGNKIKHIYQGMLLHDIGKTRIPQSILSSTKKLSPAEYDIIRQHPAIGSSFVSMYKAPQDVLDIILYHHERWDGSGYPEGLKGAEIPFLARIAAVADSYDAMTSWRPYRQAFSVQTALKELENGAGTQFDSDITRVFVDLIKEKYTGRMLYEENLY